MIQGVEWILIGILGVGCCISMFLVFYVKGDLRLNEESDMNTDEQATKMFINLINQTRRKIDIHDDGNDFEGSVYNNQEVMNVLRERISKDNIKVRCLFNDSDQHLKLLELAQSPDSRNCVRIWYLNDVSRDRDIHYKIVDGGWLVHLSSHAHGASARKYWLRKPQNWWNFQTRKQISKQYRDHFEEGLKNAVRAV